MSTITLTERLFDIKDTFINVSSQYVCTNSFAGRESLKFWFLCRQTCPTLVQELVPQFLKVCGSLLGRRNIERSRSFFIRQERRKDKDDQGGKQQKWVEESRLTRELLGISQTWMPLTGKTGEHQPELRGVKRSARCMELLNIAEADRLNKKLPKENFFSNFSQSVSRRPWGKMSCLSRTCDIYDFERDCALTSAERLTLEGLPSKHIVQQLSAMGPEKTSERDLEKFAGQGFFLGSIGTILMAYFLNDEASWWNEKVKRVPRLADATCRAISC